MKSIKFSNYESDEHISIKFGICGVHQNWCVNLILLLKNVIWSILMETQSPFTQVRQKYGDYKNSNNYFKLWYLAKYSELFL
jgi:hypothetical protein